MTFFFEQKNQNIAQVFHTLTGYMRQLWREKKSFYVEIGIGKKTRTLQQNAYMHALIHLFLDHAGEAYGLIMEEAKKPSSERIDSAVHYMKRDVARRLGIMFYREDKHGNIVEVDPKPTSKMNVDELGMMIEAIQGLLDGLGVNYPIPSQLGMKHV